MQNYNSPKERVVTPEKTNFLYVIQVLEESGDNFLARLREEARYCDIKKVDQPRRVIVQTKFISGLRGPEAEFWILDGIKAKAALSVAEMTENLQFRSQAITFASSSSGDQTFIVKEEVMFNFKKALRKPNEKFIANKSNNMCTRCEGKPKSSRPCPAISKKRITSEKVGN